ncbi:alpha/beta hydrolase [Psychrobacter sp. B38]|uniref:RBBP9/YdeN family alpha/beta hydrolase n=1 Tax=Psychrobacter sp. B38 TaxID=3143538 RepID=UPI00320D8901
MSHSNVYIIHGFQATPFDHWFQWLKNELEARGVSVKVLAMPDSSSPDPVAWQATLAENIDTFNENTFLVAHSLGCVSLLTYLQGRVDDRSIGGLILVSGFTSPLAELPQLDTFVDGQIDFGTLANAIPKRVVFGSPQDPIVPYGLTEKLAKDLGADLQPMIGAGHFLAEDGYNTFPQLLEVLLQAIFE